MMTTISRPCKRCGQSVDILPDFARLTEDVGVLCPDCVDEDNAEARREERKASLSRAWDRLCPPRFRDTDPARLPFPVKTEKALEWDHRGGYGLNLWGRPNTGKTRTLFLLLKREHFAGRSCVFFGPGEFSQSVEAANGTRGELLKRLSRVDILAFDDIDKYRLMKSHEEVFFAVLDKRMREHRPCMFTGNSNGDTLELKFKNGEALVRRIRDFCIQIHF